MHRWNPYLVGVGIGVLSWAAFAIADKPIGVTTALSQCSGVVARPIIGSEGVRANAYWARNPPAWDYGTLFLFGIALGSLVAAAASRDLKIEVVPAVWRERFGWSPGGRLLAAFVGGALVMYGARMADGCTSGNGISGSLQLAVTGWTFFITMFITGVATARLMFGRGRPHG